MAGDGRPRTNEKCASRDRNYRALSGEIRSVFAVTP